MKLASKVMQKDDRLLNIKNFFLLYIIVSIRPILWPWSHNSYKWVSTKFQCYFIKIAIANLSFFITCFVNKLTEWQWVLLWVPPLWAHFYVITKMNGWIIFQSTSTYDVQKACWWYFCSFFIYRTPPTSNLF